MGILAKLREINDRYPGRRQEVADYALGAMSDFIDRDPEAVRLISRTVEKCLEDDEKKGEIHGTDRSTEILSRN